MSLSSIVNPNSLFQPGGQTPGSAGAASPFNTRAFAIPGAALLALSQVGVSTATNATSAGSGASAPTPGTTSGAPASTAATLGATSGATATGQADSDAVQGFLQNLYAALQAQAAVDATQSSQAGASSVHGHHHHGGHGSAGLATLAEQLSSSVAPDSSNTAGASTSTTSTVGGTSPLAGSSSAFLRAFANDLSTKPAGSILSTRA